MRPPGIVDAEILWNDLGKEFQASRWAFQSFFFIVPLVAVVLRVVDKVDRRPWNMALDTAKGSFDLFHQRCTVTVAPRVSLEFLERSLGVVVVDEPCTEIKI